MKYILDGIEYEVVVEKKNNKNLYIRIKEDMKIHVSCNYFISNRDIMKILNQNEKSLQKMVNHMNKVKNNNNNFLYLGKSYDIIINDDIDDVKISSNKIYTKNIDMLNKWYENEIVRIFDDRYVYVYNHFYEDIKSPILKIRNMKTRYGVYNRKNHTITLNSQLIKFDVEKIDYVIIHELCHIIHFNHSKNFWNLVSKYCKNYKQIRKEMRI